MKFAAFCALFSLLLADVCFGTEQKKKEEHEPPFKLSEKTKETLLWEKSQPQLMFRKWLEFFLNNPNRELERQCYTKFHSNESIDFVIDIAPNPSEDTVDKTITESPMSLYLDVLGQYHGKRTPSLVYFSAIRNFIDTVTYDMKPESTHTVIYDKGRKYYIRGKELEEPITKSLNSEGGEFEDSERNLVTMWPSQTKEVQESLLHPVLKNSLGRLTKAVLWSRNNGVPAVLAKSRTSKPLYTIVITDGSSGAKIRDLVDDLSRTSVIDIGNRRFLKTNDRNELRSLVSIASPSAPQELWKLVDTCRYMACRLYDY